MSSSTPSPPSPSSQPPSSTIHNKNKTANTEETELPFCTTRNGEKGYTFEQVLLMGVPPSKSDGLFVPRTIPRLSPQTLDDWSKLSYKQLVLEIASIFIPSDEVPRKDVEAIIAKAYQVFPHPEVIPVQTLPKAKNDDDAFECVIAELFHGPSLAFKDLAMIATGLLLDYFIQKRGATERATVLVSTSGDTGSSCLAALRDLNQVRPVVVFPSGRVSKRQALQMTNGDVPSRPGAVSHVVEVMEATSDSIDQVVFKLFEDREFVSRTGLCSLNSVNWSRVLFQIPHYFYVYFQLAISKRQVAISIPTGAMGNSVAGLVAMEMGLPLKYLVLAQNENDCAVRFVQDGVLSFTFKDVVPTISPAIDILAPYNIERFLWLLSGKRCDDTREWMNKVERGEPVEIPILQHSKLYADRIKGVSVPQREVLEEIEHVWKCHRYCLDPHTAVGVRGARVLFSNESSDRLAIACLATAHPAKFPEVYSSRLGIRDETELYELPASLARCFKNPRRAITAHQRDLDQVLRRVILDEHQSGLDQSLL